MSIFPFLGKISFCYTYYDVILRAYNYNYVSPTATSFLLILLVIDLVFTLRHYNLQKFNLSFTSTLRIKTAVHPLPHCCWRRSIGVKFLLYPEEARLNSWVARIHKIFGRSLITASIHGLSRYIELVWVKNFTLKSTPVTPGFLVSDFWQDPIRQGLLSTSTTSILATTFI